MRRKRGRDGGNSAPKKIDALKTRIDAHRPLDAHMLKQIRGHFRIGMTYTSNALEGNSLAEKETKIVIENGITIGGSPVKEHLEALVHSEAYDLLFRLATHRDITEANVKELHRRSCYRVDMKQAGKYRKRRVILTGTDFIPPGPERIPALMASFVAGIPEARAKHHHPVEFAATLHKDFATILRIGAIKSKNQIY